MALKRNTALVVGTILLALSSPACTSTKPTASTDATTELPTTTTVGGAGPAVRVPGTDPASLSRLFAAWAIGQGADGYVGPCDADPSSMQAAGTWCSSEAAAVPGGQVFVLSHPGATRPSATVLIAPSDGYYRIVDSYTYGIGSPPSWVGPYLTASSMRRAMTLRQRVSSAPSKIDSTRASTK